MLPAATSRDTFFACIVSAFVDAAETSIFMVSAFNVLILTLPAESSRCISVNAAESGIVIVIVLLCVSEEVKV